MVRRKTIWIAELDNEQTITCESKKQAVQLEEKKQINNAIKNCNLSLLNTSNGNFGEKDRYNC